VSVYGTDAHKTPSRAFLARRLHCPCAAGCPLALGISSRRLATPTTLHGRSTWPRQLRSGVPRKFIVLWAGPESQPAVHRLRLWGLDLGSASPRADCHGAGTLRLTVSKVFTWMCAYSFRHPHFSHLHHTFPRWLRRCENAPLPRAPTSTGRASAGRLIPTILGASTLDE
jgi:hypothetical protein